MEYDNIRKTDANIPLVYSLEAFEKGKEGKFVKSFIVEGVNLIFLRNLFEIDLEDPDIYYQDLWCLHTVNEKQLQVLRDYVHSRQRNEIDIENYHYQFSGESDTD